jgi:O-antigen ligase
MYSRTGLAVFLLASVANCLLHYAAWRRSALLWSVFALLILPIGLRNKTKFHYVVNTIFGFQSEPGMVARREIWKETARMFLDFPVAGMGFGTYDELAYSLYRTQLDYFGNVRNRFYRNGWHAHNAYLHILAETGVLGFGAYLYLWYAILARLFSVWKSFGSGIARSDAACLFASVLSFLVLSMTEHVMGMRVYASLRMSLALSFLIVYGFCRLKPAVGGPQPFSGCEPRPAGRLT